MINYSGKCTLPECLRACVRNRPWNRVALFQDSNNRYNQGCKRLHPVWQKPEMNERPWPSFFYPNAGRDTCGSQEGISGTGFRCNRPCTIRWIVSFIRKGSSPFELIPRLRGKGQITPESSVYRLICISWLKQEHLGSLRIPLPSESPWKELLEEITVVRWKRIFW